jgi:endonuclease/exonuclease/phosphatase family metal-dependent hydrolase
MKILSWNILANEFINKRYYPMLPADILFKRSARLQQIISLLSREDADVLLLQEVMLSEYNALDTFFSRHYHLIKSKPIVWQGVRSHSMNVILLRKNMFSLRGAGITFFDFGVMVECGLKYGLNHYVPILISNVHLDDLSKAVRLKQLEELSYYFKAADNVILGGDFNENYSKTSPLYNRVKSSGLKIMNEVPTYYIGRKMCIDNIMLKGSSNKVKVKVINDYDNDVLQHFINYGSDHLPVIVITK